MLRKISFLALLLISQVAALAHASVLVPESGTDEYLLGSSMDIFEDKTATRSVAEVADRALATSFVPAASHGPSYGFRKSALWFRIQIDFSQTREQPWHLVETHPLVDTITFYLPDGRGGWTATRMGDTLPYSSRQYDHREFILTLPRQVIDGPQPVTLYVREAGEGALNIDLRLTDTKKLIERTNTKAAVFGLFYGALLAIFLYNFSLWLAARESAQFYYLVFIAGVTLLFLCLSGLGMQYVWSRQPSVNGWFPIFVCILMWAALQFTRAFLDTRRAGSQIDRVMHWMTIASIGALLLSFILSLQWSYMFGTILPTFFVFGMLGVGIIRLRQGYPPARLFVAAWTALLIGSVITAAGNFTLLQSFALTTYAAQLGTVSQLLLLSMALGARLRFLKTENVQIQRQLAVLKTHDRLTGLPNRNHLEEYLPSVLAESRHNRLTLAALYIDIDDFKSINGSFGHAIGDRILVQIAHRLQDIVANNGRIFRISGDEFVAIMPNLARSDDAILMAHNLIAAVASPCEVDGSAIHLTCSIGIRIAQGTIDNPMRLIEQADMATHKAKRNGRNNYEIYSEELDSRVAQHLRLRNELQAALLDHHLALAYLPNIERRTGRTCGFEALLRWNHPSRGVLPASEFMAVAEKTGQIIQIGQWALETACSDCARLLADGFRDARVSVNISPLQFQREDFVDSIRSALRMSNLPGENLELDVTETTLLEAIDVTRRNIEKLKTLGVNVSIDDFGTGYSSLSYLRHFEVSRIKIDEMFIRNVISDVKDSAIVKSIIGLAHHLDLAVLAEGVETESQYEFLKKCGCDQFQGFHFASPMLIDDLEKYLINERTVKPRQEPTDQGAVETILLVDDEPNILRALSRVLRKDGYRILLAESADEAFKLLALNDVQLIISDQRMPKITGTEFLSRVKTIYPHTIRIVLSGYTDLKSVTDAVNQGSIYRFLTKPWDDEALREEIRRAFSTFHSTR